MKIDSFIEHYEDNILSYKNDIFDKQNRINKSKIIIRDAKILSKKYPELDFEHQSFFSVNEFTLYLPNKKCYTKKVTDFLFDLSWSEQAFPYFTEIINKKQYKIFINKMSNYKNIRYTVLESDENIGFTIFELDENNIIEMEDYYSIFIKYGISIKAISKLTLKLLEEIKYHKLILPKKIPHKLKKVMSLI